MTDLEDAWVATIVDAMDRSDRRGHDQDLWAVHHAVLRKIGEQHLRILWRRACDRYSAIHATGILPMTGRDRLHRDRCGTVSIDPTDVRPDDNHPNDPPDDFSRPDLYDPHGTLAAPRWVDGRLSPDDDER
jgi:hypothetical protein